MIYGMQYKGQYFAAFFVDRIPSLVTIGLTKMPASGCKCRVHFFYTVNLGKVLFVIWSRLVPILLLYFRNKNSYFTEIASNQTKSSSHELWGNFRAIFDVIFGFPLWTHPKSNFLHGWQSFMDYFTLFYFLYNHCAVDSLTIICRPYMNTHN